MNSRLLTRKAPNEDEFALVSAYRRTCRSGQEHPIPVYDDGFGELYIHRDSMGISGIVRAQTWEDAHSICEDEFFPSADEEAFEVDFDAMTDHEEACWNEAYGFRPNGQGGPTPKEDRGVYARDLNGDALDRLTPQLCERWGIVLVFETY